MRYSLVVGLTCVLAARGWAGEAMGDPLGELRRGHPRLLLTNEALAEAVAAAKSDPLRAAVHAKVIATAESVLNAPVTQHLPGGDPSLDQSRYAVHYITECALAYRLTHDKRYLARVKRELVNVEAFPDWTPEHFLTVAELAYAVGIAYDWLYPHFTPEERAAIKRALLDKALAFADGAYRPGGPVGRGTSWAKTVNNWNQVCNAGLLCAALAVAEDEPALARKVVNGVRESLPRGMAAYAPDGEYPEGPGYWTYGTTYNVIALAALESALGSDFGLSKAEGFSRTAVYQLAVQGAFGLAFNYADSTDDQQNSPAKTWLAEKFRLPTGLRHTRALLEAEVKQGKYVPFDPTIQGQVVNRFFPLHAIWYPAEVGAPVRGAADIPLDLHFRGVADIAIFRSAWSDPQAIFVGFKAGENSTHHNHLDLGSFVLDADGERWAMDLGPDKYSLPGYFDNVARRWTYYRLNNHGHGTVTPGDALQQRGVVAPITAFGRAATRAFAIADLTPAYPNETAELRRGIALLDRARVLVQDEYKPTERRAPLHWRMITRAQVDVADDGRSALLSAKGKALRVEVLAPAGARISVQPARPPMAVVNQNLGCFEVGLEIVPASDGLTTAAVLLSPIGEKWPRLSSPAIEPLAEWR